MSTFNGERFLEEQLNSLVEQSFKNFQVLIRDDGSTDNTKTILMDFENYLNIVYCHGTSHLGLFGSYSELLKRVRDFKFIALCDQDDIWAPRKLEIQIESLKTSEKQLSTCNFTLIDENSKNLGFSHKFEKERASYPFLLIRNTLPGNTYVFSGKLLKDFQFTLNMPHDWYLVLIAAGLNSIYNCKEDLVAYRQHDFNFIGYKKNQNFSHNLLRRSRSVILWRNNYLSEIIGIKKNNYLSFMTCISILLSTNLLSIGNKIELALFLLCQQMAGWVGKLFDSALVE